MTKKNVKKNTVFYYLRVNHEHLIDFSSIPDLYNMEDYLKLNLFTGYFTSRENLIEALKGMGLIELGLNIYDIEIVRRRGNKKEGYCYEYITNNLAYKRDISFLTIRSLKEFIQDNRKNYDLIMRITDYYRDALEKKASAKERSISYLESSLYLLPDGVEKKELLESLQKEKNSLGKFEYELGTLNFIAGTVNYFKQNGPFERELELEYIESLDRFVENETQYVRGQNRTQNNRGLVKMAKLFSKLSKEFSGLDLPVPTRKYESVMIEFTKVLKGETLKMKLNRVQVEAELEVEIDPDSYMFLDVEDFERLRTPEDSEDIKNSIDDAILELEEKKGPKM